MENDHRNLTIEIKNAFEDIRARNAMEVYRHHVYIIKVVTPSILVIIFLIIILIIYIKFFGSKVKRCSVVTSFSKTAPGDGKEASGTWRRVKVMSHRKLPPIPEEKQEGATANSCQINRSAPDQNELVTSNIMDINDPRGQNTIFFYESADDSDYSEFTMNMGNIHQRYTVGALNGSYIDDEGRKQLYTAGGLNGGCINDKARMQICRMRSLSGSCGVEPSERPHDSGDDGGHVYDEIFTQERLGRLTLEVARGSIPDLIPHYVNLPLPAQVPSSGTSTSELLASTSLIKRCPSTRGSLRSSRSSSGTLKLRRPSVGSIRSANSGKRSKRYVDLHSVIRNHRINCSTPTTVVPILEQGYTEVVDCKQKLNESLTQNKDEEEYSDVVEKDDQVYNDDMQTLETTDTVVEMLWDQPSDSVSPNPRIKPKSFGRPLSVGRQDSFKLSHCQRVRRKKLFKEIQNKSESFVVGKISISEEQGESSSF